MTAPQTSRELAAALKALAMALAGIPTHELAWQLQRSERILVSLQSQGRFGDQEAIAKVTAECERLRADLKAS